MQKLRSALLLVTLCALGGLAANGCGGGGHGGGAAAGTIGSAGGSVTAKGATVTVPAGATSQPVTITVQAGTLVASGAFAEAGSPFLLGPSGTTFSAPVTLKIPYDPAKLQAAGRTTADIVVLHRNDVTGNVTTLRPTSVDTTNHVVTVDVTSLSTVQAAVPAAIDLASSSVIVNPSSVLADGTQKATIQVAVKNTKGEAYPGLTVVLGVNGSQNALVQPAGATDALGQTSGTLTSTLAETKTVTATIGSTALTTKPTVAFTLTPTLRITGPLPFEKVPVGTTLSISWTSMNVSETVNLSASTDGGATYTAIGSGLASVGSTTWTPPSNTTRARLRLVTASGTVQDVQPADFTYARVWFVDGAATGLADGLTWQTAITNIQTAVDLASFGDQVWVANKTTYTGGNPVVRARTGVTLVGGFVGRETSLSQRAQPLTPTTIDGQNVRRTILIDTGGTTTVDGFRFYRGQSFGDAGAGLYAGMGSVALSNCTFEANKATGGGIGGGAAFFGCPTVTITNCVFTLNQGDLGGGALFVSPNPNSITQFTVRFTKFDQNSSQASDGCGGAVCLKQSGSLNTNAAITFDSCSFTQNTSPLDGGALYAHGCAPRIDRCTFTGNTATRNGGGVALLFSRPLITLSTFSTNTANGTSGGVPTPGLVVFGAGGVSLERVNGGYVKQCSFFSNTSSAGAGVLVKGPINPGDPVSFENCVFAGNTASLHGGGVFSGAEAFSRFNFCTITGNNASLNGNGFGIMAACSGSLSNSIVYGNVGAIGSNVSGFENIAIASSLTVVTNSDVGPAFPGNLSTDPLFVNPATNDYRPGVGSPCIGAANPVGAPTVDRDNLPRDAQPDIGAYERR